LPLSATSTAAISSARSAMRSPSRIISRPRLVADSPRHASLSKAVRAARTARSTSSAPARACVAQACPVVGFSAANVSLLAAAISSPPT
jgi:hypothetical protein